MSDLLTGVTTDPTTSTWGQVAMAVSTVLVALVTVGGTVFTTRWTSRGAKSASSDTDTHTDQDRYDRIVERLIDAEKASAAATTRVGELEQDLDQMRIRVSRAEHRQRRLAVLVGPLVDWIDTGATPPVPHISADLRAFLADADL